jgi:hypothetical protein
MTDNSILASQQIGGWWLKTANHGLCYTVLPMEAETWICHAIAGLHVTFCLQSCSIMPDGSDKTIRLRADMTFCMMWMRFEDLTKDGQAGALFSNKTADKSLHVDAHPSNPRVSKLRPAGHIRPAMWFYPARERIVQKCANWTNFSMSTGKKKIKIVFKIYWYSILC